MSEDQESATSQPGAAIVRRRRRWPWVLLLLAIGLVSGLRAVLPLAVERGAAYGSRYYLGLPVRIDNADFSLIHGEVVLEGVSIGARPDAVTPTDAALAPPAIDPAQALLHWDRVAVHLSWDDLRRHTLRLTDFVLDSPSVRVERESDGKIDPLRYAKPLAPQAQEPAETEPAEQGASEPWKIAVDKFELRSPGAVVVDPPSGENLLEFSLDEFLLESVAMQGSDFSLGGIGIEGPVLRVRRDLVLANKSKQAGAEIAAVAPPASGTAPAPAPSPEVVAAPAATPESAATPAPEVAAAPAVTPEGAPTPAPAPQPAIAPATQRAEKRGYRITKIDIARAKFTWITDQGPLDVALALKASDVTMDEGKRFPIDLQLQIGQGTIGIAGDVGILPPAYHGTFNWSGLPFPPLLLAALPQFAPWLRSADSTGDLRIDAELVAADSPAALRIAGRCSIEAVSVADPGGEETLLGWKQFEVVAREVMVPLSEDGKPIGTTRVGLDSVKLVEPKIRYTRPSPALDALLGRSPAAPVADAKSAEASTKGKAVAASTAKSKGAAESAKKGAAATAGNAANDAAAAAASAKKPAAVTAGNTAKEAATGAATPAVAQPVDLSIASLELIGGDFELVDNTVKPTTRSHVHDLSLSAKDVRFPGTAAAAIRVRATLPQSAALSIDGDLRPGNNGDFTVSLQKLDLTAFSPYATAAAGATLDAGQASIKTKVRMRGGKTEVDNALLLRKFGISLHDPSSFERSFGVPIDLALALLRDPSGNISLNIPVRIDEKGASVSIGAVIASALRQALIGAVTAPLKMLGAVFGGSDSAGGGFGIEPIAATPGSATLAADSKGRIDALVQLLAQRPKIGFVLRGRVGVEDRPLVAEQILAERWKAGESLPDVEGSGYLVRRRIGQAAAKKVKGETVKLSEEDQAVYDRTIAAVSIPDARLQALAKSRADGARTELLAKGVAATRVSVGDPDAEGTPAVVVRLASQ